MGTKTIGLREDAYKQLKARKRDDESFTDLVERLLEESTPEWREGFGSLSMDEVADLERTAKRSRERSGEGLSTRQRSAIDELRSIGEDADETT